MTSDAPEGYATAELPFPLSQWVMYAGHGSGKYKSKPYRAYWEQLPFFIRKQKFQWPEGFFGYEMQIDYHSPTWLTKNGSLKKKDVDNYIKTLTDPLTAFLVKEFTFDDCQIVDLRVRKVYDRKEFARVTVVGVSSILDATKEVDLI